MTDTLKSVIPDWYSFALQLGLDDAVVQEINGEPHNTCTECFSALLRQWIQVRGHDANVTCILVACEKIDNKELAIQLLRDKEMHQNFPSMLAASDNVLLMKLIIIIPLIFFAVLNRQSK